MSQVVKVEHSRSYVYERCDVHWCCTAAAAAAAATVPLLYCADAFEIQRKGRLELSLVAFRMKCPHTAHTGTHRSTVRGWLKTNTVKYGHCYTAVAATTSKAYGVIQAHSSSRQHSKDEEEQ